MAETQERTTGEEVNVLPAFAWEELVLMNRGTPLIVRRDDVILKGLEVVVGVEKDETNCPKYVRTGIVEDQKLIIQGYKTGPEQLRDGKMILDKREEYDLMGFVPQEVKDLYDLVCNK